MKLAKILFLVFAFLTFCAAEDKACKNIPLNESLLEGRVTAALRTFGTNGVETRASIEVRNNSRVPLNGIYMVVEYYKLDERLLSMTFYSATDPVSKSLNPIVPYSSRFMSAWPLYRSVLPASKEQIDADSPRYVLECPDAARISVAQLVWSDGTTVTLKKQFRNDAIPSDTSEWNLESLPDVNGAMIVANLAVDETGKAKLFSVEGDHSRLADWFAEQVQHVAFLPEIYNNLSVASTLRAVVRINPTRRWPTKVVHSMRGNVITVIDLVRTRDGSRYELFWGGTPLGAYSTLKKNVVTAGELVSPTQR